MNTKRKDLSAELQEYRCQYDILQRIGFSRKENKAYYKMVRSGEKLPENVHRSEFADDEFFSYYQAELSEAERTEYLTYKQLDLLRTIKNCLVFFTVLVVISLIIAFFAGVYIGLS